MIAQPSHALFQIIRGDRWINVINHQRHATTIISNRSVNTRAPYAGANGVAFKLECVLGMRRVTITFELGWKSSVHFIQERFHNSVGDDRSDLALIINRGWIWNFNLECGRAEILGLVANGQRSGCGEFTQNWIVWILLANILHAFLNIAAR